MYALKTVDGVIRNLDKIDMGNPSYITFKEDGLLWYIPWSQVVYVNIERQ